LQKLTRVLDATRKEVLNSGLTSRLLPFVSLSWAEKFRSRIKPARSEALSRLVALADEEAALGVSLESLRSREDSLQLFPDVDFGRLGKESSTASEALGKRAEDARSIAESAYGPAARAARRVDFKARARMLIEAERPARRMDLADVVQQTLEGVDMENGTLGHPVRLL